MSIRRSLTRQVLVGGVLALALGACAPLERNHGYLPTQSDLDSLVIGADTRGIVEETIGRPQNTGVLGEGTWYYVENTVSTVAFFAPRVTDRTVLALDFDDDGVLQGIERFGLEDGRVVNLVTRVTPTDRRRRSILNQIFGNIGSVGPVLPG